MAPKEIFIVRHGERMDKKVPGYSMTTGRPHDPPLTEEGIVMAEELGKYLHNNKGLAPAAVVILSSPLFRCVQTAAGVARGMAAATAATLGGSSTAGVHPPIYVEPSLVESAHWQNIDLHRNAAVAHDKFLQCPDPLWRTIADMNASVDPDVHPTRPYGSLGGDPEIYVEDFNLKERDMEGRCRKAAATLISSADPAFDGKTVICVSHGEASQGWAKYILADPESIDVSENPAYTAFLHLAPEGEKWVAKMPAFLTPHLPEVPSEY